VGVCAGGFPLFVWKDRVVERYDVFAQNRSEFHLKLAELDEDRDTLESSWKALSYSNILGKKRRLETVLPVQSHTIIISTYSYFGIF
jgi:hypothetical protein